MHQMLYKLGPRLGKWIVPVTTNATFAAIVGGLFVVGAAVYTVIGSNAGQGGIGPYIAPGPAQPALLPFQRGVRTMPVVPRADTNPIGQPPNLPALDGPSMVHVFAPGQDVTTPLQADMGSTGDVQYPPPRDAQVIAVPTPPEPPRIYAEVFSDKSPKAICDIHSVKAWPSWDRSAGQYTGATIELADGTRHRFPPLQSLNIGPDCKIALAGLPEISDGRFGVRLTISQGKLE